MTYTYQSDRTQLVAEIVDLRRQLTSERAEWYELMGEYTSLRRRHRRIIDALEQAHDALTDLAAVADSDDKEALIYRMKRAAADHASSIYIVLHEMRTSGHHSPKSASHNIRGDQTI